MKYRKINLTSKKPIDFGWDYINEKFTNVVELDSVSINDPSDPMELKSFIYYFTGTRKNKNYSIAVEVDAMFENHFNMRVANGSKVIDINIEREE